MRTTKDTSYGIVPVRWHDGAWEVLLIHQISNVRGDSYWILPKGHAEGAETPVETARRELFEETGLVPERVEESTQFTLSYTFRIAQKRIAKQVTFYLGYIAAAAPLTLRPAEVKEAVWCRADAAYKRITHENARGMLRKVFAYLETVPRP